MTQVLQRVWHDPIVPGEPVPFDPEKHAPQMTDEELKELLDDDDD